MRGTMAVAVCLIALLCLVNVSAYRTASVDAPLTLTVTDTRNAGLSFRAGANNAFHQVSFINGMMAIDFRRAGGSVLGLQPPNRTQTATLRLKLAGDQLRMNRVFYVSNNSSVCQEITITSGTAVPSLLYIYGARTGDSSVLMADNSGTRSRGSVVLGSAPGNREMSFDFEWLADSGSTSSGTFSLLVAANRTTQCPPGN